MRRMVCFSTAVVFMSHALLQAAEYYVSPNGSDAASGTAAAPFRTIQKAADIMKAGDICNIRAGIYRESVKPRNSGTSAEPLVFRSFNNESVTISGADPLANWTLHKDKIYQAPMDWDLGDKNQLLFDGKMMYQARWPNHPNDGVFAVHDARMSGGGSGWLTCDTLPDFPWVGSIIWVSANEEWCQWTARITSYDAAQKRLTFGMPMGWVGWMAPERNAKFNLTGIMEALDYPGEWFYDKVAKKVYFWSPLGDNPGGHIVEAKRREFVFNMSSLSHVKLMGVSIVGGGIDMRNTQNCAVKNVRATYVAHHAAGEVGAGSGNSTTNNAGVFISGANDTVERCEIAYSSGTGIKISGSNHQILNSWIHHCDYMATYDAAISNNGTGVTIRQCRVWYAGRDCINFQGSEAKTTVSYNDIAFSGMRADDCAGIYMVGHDGQGTNIHHNWIHDAQCTQTNSYHIMNDNNSKGYNEYNNVFWNAKRGAISCGSANDIAIYNNTFWKCNTGTIMLPIDNWIYNGNPLVNIKIYNNIIDLGTMTWNTPSGVEIKNNVFFSPGFVDPWVARDKGDFRLKAGSAPIDKGMTIAGYTEGFSGKAPDCGAYEFGGADSLSNWKAGITWDTSYSTGIIRKSRHEEHKANESVESPLLSVIRTNSMFKIIAKYGGVVNIFDAKGVRIQTLSVKSSSPVFWDGRDAMNKFVPKGLYVFELRNDSRRAQEIVVK